jgi:hypothetical protein
MIADYRPVSLARNGGAVGILAVIWNRSWHSVTVLTLDTDADI